MRSSVLTIAVSLVAISLLGCNKPTDPSVKQSEKVAASKPDLKLITLHIDGFKKSKSGGT